MDLYTYFRSSAAYRVRIALNLKALPYQSIPVHLVKNGGEQLQRGYRAVNPSALLPALDDGGAIITQSLAMLEYLEEVYPQAPLLPADPAGRARVRALAQAVACEIHPLGNLRVLKYLTGTLAVTDEARLEWSRHWIREGFATLESLLARSPGSGRFCHGERASIADCCLVPQVYNAVRFGVDLAPYPTIVTIDAACAELPAFMAAHPARQPDAE
jgi:maleylpyruvate isomerase